VLGVGFESRSDVPSTLGARNREAGSTGSERKRGELVTESRIVYGSLCGCICARSGIRKRF